MREKERRGFGWGVILFAALVLVALRVGAVPAEESAVIESIGEKIIRIGANADQPIRPTIARVKKGTTIIWVNRGSTEAEVRFVQGDKIEQVCAAPVGFSRALDGSFRTGKLPFAGTASLCVLEAGTYTYEVRIRWLLGGSAPAPSLITDNGTIVVE